MRPFGRILLTNDDGIDAPGLKVAEDIAAQLAEEVWVVAPEHDQSGGGQGISLHTPLRVVVSGPAGFNGAARAMLEEMGVEAEAITILSA